MRHRWVSIGTIAFAAILVLAGIRFIAAPAFVGSPDTVHIVVTDIQLSSAKETVIFDRVFSRQATAVYGQLMAGAEISSSDVQSCPSYSNETPYYHYKLIFVHLGLQVATAWSDAHGCADFIVTYPDGSTETHFWETDNHVSLWMKLHEMVNVPLPINTCIGIDSKGFCISIPSA